MSAITEIPAGRTFTEADIVVYADSAHRTLDQAVQEADLLVSTPHSGAAIPAELVDFLAPTLTRRLQYDFSDVATANIVRAWAQRDPRVVAVINPHPRLVRDPNRKRPEDPAADLATAINRTRIAGPWQKVDLTGVDAIRPCTFSFFPILKLPATGAELNKVVETFVAVGERGVDVYERIRDDLTQRFIDARLADGGPFTRLSFHDTMNTTATRQGAVRVPREPKDQLPNIVALSNRGDAHGECRSADDLVTMDPARLRKLADAHRLGFSVAEPTDVELNRPYLGSEEIISAGAWFRGLGDAGAQFDAVQAEFLREFLLGAAAAKELKKAGKDWVPEDETHVAALARQCQRSWDIYRVAIAP